LKKWLKRTRPQKKWLPIAHVVSGRNSHYHCFQHLIIYPDTRHSDREIAVGDVCDACAGIFRAGSPWRAMCISNLVDDDMGYGYRTHHLRFESFIKAIEQGCPVCKAVHARLPQAVLAALRHARVPVRGDPRLLSWNARLTQVRQRHPKFSVSLRPWTMSKKYKEALEGCQSDALGYSSEFSLSRLTGS
jgi:hypothetical protein